MTALLHYIIPKVTSAAGSYVTMDNLLYSGIKIIAFELQQLLMKPGPDLLLTMSNFKRYCGWPDSLALVINATQGSFKNNQLTVRSVYDGGTTRLSYQELVQLLIHINPDTVLLPYSLMDEDLFVQWPTQMKIFYSAPLEDCMVAYNQPDEAYIIGSLNTVSAQLAPLVKTVYFETDKPMTDAVNGLAYASTNVLNLMDPAYRQDHQVIDSTCGCTTCLTRLSRAYLHHLLQHTPLLATRLVIQHNLYKVVNVEWLQAKQWLVS